MKVINYEDPSFSYNYIFSPSVVAIILFREQDKEIETYISFF